jgi:hypothetical protein
MATILTRRLRNTTRIRTNTTRYKYSGDESLLSTCSRLLQGHPGDNGWDDSLFRQDRDGNPTTFNGPGPGPAISVQGPDEYPLNSSSAPTRPPSRSSMIPLVSDSQESGVIGSDGSSGKYFGPATRQHYEESQWALTFPAATVMSHFADVEPPDRKRQDEEPGFVKPNPDHPFGAALISALGQLPFVLQMWLKYGTVLQDYGSDPDWWAASPIRQPLTVDVDTAQDEQEDREKIWFCEQALQSMHRAAAFFQRSTRSYYGESVFTLLLEFRKLLEADKDDFETETWTSILMKGWTTAAASVAQDDMATTLFQNVIASQDDEGETKFSNCFEFKLDVPRLPGRKSISLYDVIDEALWAQDIDGRQSANFWLAKVPHILVLSLYNADAAARSLGGLEVSPVIYLDRYLEDNVSAAKEMRRNIAQVKSTLAKTEARKMKLKTFRAPNGTKSQDVDALFERTIKFLQPSQSTDVDGDVVMESSTTDSDTSRLVGMLHALHAKVQHQLEGNITFQ